jgi:hypothetical protein
MSCQVGTLVFMHGGQSVANSGCMYLLNTNSSRNWLDLSNIVGGDLCGQDKLHGHVLIAAPPLLLRYGGTSLRTNDTGLFGCVYMLCGGLLEASVTVLYWRMILWKF